jgi:hypothetical protein
MKKILTTTLSAMLFSAVGFAPAFADDSSPMKNVMMLPVRATGLVAGTAIGTPIAAVRMSAHDTKALATSIGGDNKMKMAAGCVVALPVGLFEGTVQGCYYGPHNAIKNCVDHPFSKDTFSLGDMGSD